MKKAGSSTHRYFTLLIYILTATSFQTLQPIHADISGSHDLSSNTISMGYYGRNAEGFLSSPADDGYDHYIDQMIGRYLRNQFPGIQKILAQGTLYYTAESNQGAILKPQLEVTKLLISVLRDLSNAPLSEKPLLLLASERLSARLNSTDYSSPEWKPYGRILEHYHIKFVANSSKGVLVENPMLQEAWENYSESQWTEDAFVLDLKNAFGCRDGNQEYHVMIDNGRIFLQKHPQDPRDPWVDFVIGVAFADWYAISQFADLREAHILSKDDLDVGASPVVRKSAIDYFLKTALGAPHTDLGKAAAAAIKGLSAGLPPSEVAYVCWVH